MIHPDTELRFISETIGYGVIAVKDIPRGTITWVQDKLDREFTPQEVEAMEPVYREILDIYTFRNASGNHVLCWDHGRYVNHSFRSNCLSTPYDFEIAIRDIKAGEQITDDYGYLNLSEPFTPADEGTRRKIVYPDDLKKYYRRWDKDIRSSFQYITKVDQPLKSILHPDIWQEVKTISNGVKEPESILSLYYAG